MDRVLPPNSRLIPEHAKRVFTGVIFDVYQWTETLYDGSSAIFEMLKRPDTVKVIAIKEDKLVVIEDSQPVAKTEVTFPGGRINETDSSWVAAAQREMLEETGLSFKNWKLIEVVQPIHKIEWFVAWYLAYDLIDQVKPTNDKGEKIKVSEYNLDYCFKAIFDEKNPETNYVPSAVTSVASINDLINIGEYNNGKN